jgi:hypothetical protein
VKNKQALYRINEEINIPHTTKCKKAKWTGYNLHMDCLLKTHYCRKKGKMKKM